MIPTGRQVALWGLPLLLTVVAVAVPAVLLMMAGCVGESEQAESKTADAAVRPVAEQSAPAVREKADTKNTVTGSGQQESSEPESMDDLLDGIKDRIDSDKKYVAAVAESVSTNELALDRKSGTYTVKSGDSLASIAKSHYGDSAKYMAIYNANKDILANPNSLNVGQVLKFP